MLTLDDLKTALRAAQEELVGANVQRYLELTFAMNLIRDEIIKVLEAGR